MRLRLSPLLWLGMLLCLRLSPRLWLSMLLRLRLGTLLLWLGNSASRNHWSDRLACMDGLHRCKNGRMSVVDGGKLLAVLCCLLLVL